MVKLLDRTHTAMMLAVVFFATFMDGIDGSIVNVALPNIGMDFGVDTATVSWTSIIYMMVLAGTLVAFARIAADTGVRMVMSVGLLIFTVSSLFCGISPSFGVLIAARALQAVGAGMMAAAGPMCCTEHLPENKLGFGLSIVTIGASVGFALGPALGGFIVEYTTWNWIFLINLPIGAIAIPLMLKAIPATPRTGDRIKLDLRGTLILLAGITLITFAFETLSYSSMRIISIVSAVAGVLMLVLFVKVEHRTPIPLLNVSLFRRLDFASIFICLMLINMVFMGVLYLIPFYGEICLSMSSSRIGLFMLVSALVTAVFGMPMAKLSDVYGRKWFCVASGLFAAAAFCIFGILTDNMSEPLLFSAMFLMGLSWACVGGPMASRLVEHAEDDRDMASSLTNEAYYVGGAVGTAVTAMLFTLFSGTEGIDIQNVTSADFIDGFSVTALILMIFALTISVLSIIVKDRKN